MKAIYRIPVLLAVIGAYLNTADLLASFQVSGREWVGWVGAASLAVGLLVSTEELAKRGKGASWVLVLAVMGFGFAELSGQVLHSAFVRNDALVLNEFWQWVLSYVSPSVPVVVGVAMPLIVRFGGLSDESSTQDSVKEVLREVLTEVRLGRGSAAQAKPKAARPPRRGRRTPEGQMPLGYGFNDNSVSSKSGEVMSGAG